MIDCTSINARVYFYDKALQIVFLFSRFKSFAAKAEAKQHLVAAIVEAK